MNKRVLLILFSFLLLLIGSAYFVFLYTVFPKLVSSHGGGERFTLSEANDFTFQILWEAHSRLHLSLQANDTIELYIVECILGYLKHSNMGFITFYSQVLYIDTLSL